jgi:hypothetical protein
VAGVSGPYHVGPLSRPGPIRASRIRPSWRFVMIEQRNTATRGNASDQLTHPGLVSRALWLTGDSRRLRHCSQRLIDVRLPAPLLPRAPVLVGSGLPGVPYRGGASDQPYVRSSTAPPGEHHRSVWHFPFPAGSPTVLPAERTMVPGTSPFNTASRH